MQRDDSIRLRHMQDAAEEAIEFARGRTRADLDADRMLVLALVKEIEIIGEAAFRMSPRTRDQLPEIPWDDVIGMRHRLVHAYFDINLDILWRTVLADLPTLLQLLSLRPGEDSTDNDC
jgi:uncharacterized protein with HEPN domain